MSKAYVIDKDGIIIETIVAWCSQDNGDGTRIVKFKNEDEERRLIAMSETQKRIIYLPFDITHTRFTQYRRILADEGIVFMQVVKIGPCILAYHTIDFAL